MKRRIACVVMCLLGLIDTSSAQGLQTGTIRGTIVDQERVPLGNVKVTLTSAALPRQITSTTASDGSYTFKQLPPGEYQIALETTQFAPIQWTTRVWLGLSVDQHITVEAPGDPARAPIVSETQSPIATPMIAANFTHDLIDALPTARTLLGIAQLAPGVTTSTPNRGQLTISGAFAFDNVFMLNGVDITEDFFASSQDLFIEDAIDETSVLTSGITAEYGRFTGGIVNAVTKSGGDMFSGSYRVNLSNPRWTKQTPFELCDPAATASTCRVAARRSDTPEASHEGTFGGPISRNRLWFFFAGKHSDVSMTSSLPLSGAPVIERLTNARGELKLTAALADGHTLTGGYLTNKTTNVRHRAFDFTVDSNAVGDREIPNSYSFANYRASLHRNAQIEAQFSQRTVDFKNAGGMSKALSDSPFLALNILTGGSRAHYNGQYFDATDPDSRSSLQVTGNLTLLKSTKIAGGHDLKVGYEFFRRERTGGYSQSATGYVYVTDYLTDASRTTPVLDAQGRFIPLWVPGETLIESWIPTRGAKLNIDHYSSYAQDHWAINRQWSADIGVRFERVRSESTGLAGVNNGTLVPRLGVGYDVKGDGRHVVHASYGHYAGRYHEAYIGKDRSVDTPELLVGVYVGPVGEGRAFEVGLDPKNYITLLGHVPTANVSVEDGLSPPIVREFSTSYGLGMINGRGFAQIAYVQRDWSDFVENDISISNGTTQVVKNGFNAGSFTNIVYRNTDRAKRAYRALELQGRYNIAGRWSISGNLTRQLKNEGNYAGEGTNRPGLGGPIAEYPEIFSEARHYPLGRLPGYQQNKLRLWSVYQADFGRMGDASISGLIRSDSSPVYSLVAIGQPLTAIQSARLSAAGYPDAPLSQAVYFGARGSEDFKGYSVLDVGLGYNVPVFKTLRPWLKLDIYNVFNIQKQIAWNTTVYPDPASSTDALGLATGYIKDASFGKATSNDHFPAPFQGETGGRTLRLSGGLRF